MGEKLAKFFKTVKCLDKFFDNLHDEKVITCEAAGEFRVMKDNIKESIQKAMQQEDAKCAKTSSVETTANPV